MQPKLGEYWKTNADGIVYIADVDGEEVTTIVIKTNNTRFNPGDVYKGNKRFLYEKLNLDGHPDEYIHGFKDLQE
jgi:hypothetical protein